MPDDLLGPFTITPAHVSGLGASFTSFVNALLRAEVAIAGLSSVAITTTDFENIGDEGVDVGITRAVESRHVPAGESAWQFKRGDCAPAKCAAELRRATRALDVLRNGGRYRLVLGVDINDRKVRSRRKALIDEAARLGITLASDDAIEVLTASDLAEWAEQHPSLAVSKLIGGVRGSVEDFSDWSNSGGATTTYVESDARKQAVQLVRDFVADPGATSMRIEGVSGLGKSRTVLEAVRGQACQAITVYVREADKFQSSLLRYLTGDGRVAVIVVDECDAQAHKTLKEALPAGTKSRLITIGEPEPPRTGQPPLALPPMEDHKLAEVVRVNLPNVGSEAAMFVAEIAGGNVRLALVLAEAVERSPRAIAAHLITLDVIKVYVTDALPTGTDFQASCALALLLRVGVADDVASELELLADGLGIPIANLRAAVRTLGDLRLLSLKGRYRSVTPQPLAVYLASCAWEDFGAKIADDLVPTLPPHLLSGLLERGAEVGPTSAVLNLVDRLLASEHIFGSLDALEDGEHLGLIRSLAILAPQKVMDVLANLISAATLPELTTAQRSRRTLVRTLEALAWHSVTFEAAADALLQLAQAETENFANNASGAWCALFGVMLPNTAASPQARLDYLSQKATAIDVPVRRLVVKAAKALVQPHETSFVSGERQLGVLVERRGTPATYGDVWAYQRAGISLLRQFVDDADLEIAETAVEALVHAIHPFLEHQPVRDELFDALQSLPGPALRRVRTEVTHLGGLFTRVDGVAARQAGLDLLIEALPVENPDDRLRSLLQTRRWDLKDGELQRLIDAAVTSLLATQSATSLAAIFDEEKWEASFELGRSLASRAPRDDMESRLAALVSTPNSPGLVGYLHGLIDAGDTDAFDDLIDGPLGQAMTPSERLVLSVRGPQSDCGWARALNLLPTMPVQEGARCLFGWHIDLDPGVLNAILVNWQSRIESQGDYNAAIDFAAMVLHRRRAPAGAVEARVVALVELRRAYPDVGQQEWGWTQLAKRQLESDPQGLFTALLESIDDGGMHLYAPSEESQLVRDAFSRVGFPAWEQVMAKLAANSWRVQSDFRGWMLDFLSTDDITSWIGSDLQRARLVASVTNIGTDGPSQLVRYLLDNFGGDQAVSYSLAGDYISGSWSGHESSRWDAKIAQLRTWLEADEPEAVKRWARERITSLENLKDDALRREAEDDQW